MQVSRWAARAARTLISPADRYLCFGASRNARDAARLCADLRSAKLAAGTLEPEVQAVITLPDMIRDTIVLPDAEPLLPQLPSQRAPTEQSEGAPRV